MLFKFNFLHLRMEKTTWSFPLCSIQIVFPCPSKSWSFHFNLKNKTDSGNLICLECFFSSIFSVSVLSWVFLSFWHSLYLFLNPILISKKHITLSGITLCNRYVYLPSTVTRVTWNQGLALYYSQLFPQDLETEHNMLLIHQ